MQSPVKKIYITQVFGANPSSYARFGLKGHNGLDLRAFLPNGERCYDGGKSEVFAPHDGIVKECAYDAGGYGNYVKIENEKEGSVLAHFSSLPILKLGQQVKKGSFIGYQGTTGNSTGIHLHWGYYKIPRDRSNGYNGFINQEGLYSSYGESPESTPMADELMQITKADFEKLRKNSETLDAIASLLGLEKNLDADKYIEAIKARTKTVTEIKEVKVEVPVEVIKEVHVVDMSKYEDNGIKIEEQITPEMKRTTNYARKV